MTRWDDLFAVQERDTAADQLEHRRRTLGERAELETVTARLAELDRRIAELGERHDGLARGQQRLEDEIASLRAKAEQSNSTLYGGTVTNPRQLQALQDEIEALGRRVSHLEDEELELMEAAEPLEAELAELSAERARLDQQAAALRDRIAEQEAEIDRELAGVRAERETLAAALDDGLLAEYDALRRRLGGIAIARLVGGSCQGCHLALSAVEVDRIKHLDPDAVVHCEECGRLLAR